MCNNAEAAPPINNLLQPDIYNRLDAQAIERTRVVNSQLDKRLSVQQRMIAKYRLAAERVYRREKERVKEELSRIGNRLPTVSRIKDFRQKYFYNDRPLGRRGPSPSGLSDAGHGGRKANPAHGQLSDRGELPFCQRFYLHHMPTKSRYYRPRSPHLPPVSLRLAASTEEGDNAVVAVDGGDDAVLGDGVAAVAAVVAGASAEGVEELAGGVAASSLTVTDKQVLVATLDKRAGGSSADVTGQTVSPSREPHLSGSESQRAAVTTHHGGDNPSLGHDEWDEIFDLRPRSQNDQGRNGTEKPSRRNTGNFLNVPPAIQKQNLRLSLSSPQLFQG